MKIALVTPYDYPYPGGVTEHIRHLDRELRRLGHDTRILAASTAEADTLPAHVIRLPGEVLPLPINGSTARLVLTPGLNRRVEEILRDERFDIIHFHEPEAPLLSWTVLSHSTSVNVGTFHAYVQDVELQKAALPLLKYVWHQLDGRILVSPALAPAFASLAGTPPGGTYRIIPNGIDMARYSSTGIDPIAGFDDGRPNILFVGRPEPRKGLPVLLEALPLIQRQVPGTRLLVVGAIPGEDRVRLEQAIQERCLQDVHLVGRISDQDLPRYYRTATVFAAPSLGGESFGIILLEAMAAGLPVVASRIPGYQSVMQDGKTGLFVPAGDEKSLAQTLASLLQDGERRAGLSTQGQAAARLYDWKRVAPQVLAYYEDLLKHRSARSVFSLSAPAWIRRWLPAQAQEQTAHIRMDLDGWFKVEVAAKLQREDQRTV
jgi:phosphatidylinositol alpha-mannosyltransferase